MVPVHDYEKRYAEALAITKKRVLKHEPFVIVGGGAYSWYFTVVMKNVQVASLTSTSCCIMRQVGSGYETIISLFLYTTTESEIIYRGIGNPPTHAYTLYAMHADRAI